MCSKHWIYCFGSKEEMLDGDRDLGVTGKELTPRNRLRLPWRSLIEWFSLTYRKGKFRVQIYLIKI